MGLLVLFLSAKIFLFPEKIVVMPDFSNAREDSVVLWASENKTEVSYEYTYSETVEKKAVISQEPAKDTQIRKGDPVRIVISLGADPMVEVELPDFTGMTFTEIESFVAENKLQDVSYEYENSSTVESGKFISVNTTETKVRRNKLLIFKISLGEKQAEPVLIEVPDFSSYTRNEATSWGNANHIAIKFSFVSSTTIEKGNLVRQSASPKSMIEESSSIVLTYSLGKPVEAVNFEGKTKMDVLNWLESIDDRVKVNFEEKYSSTVKKNYVISNSPKEGTLNDGSTIRVTISLGMPEIEDYTGKSYELLKKDVEEINKKGANLTLKLSAEESDTYSKDLIISQSTSGEVALDATITVVYSSGRFVTVGNYSTVEELLEFCITNNLPHRISAYRYSDSLAKGALVSYDHKGERVEEGTTISYVESLGKFELGNYIGKSRADLENDLKAAYEQGAPSFRIEESREYDNSTMQPKDIIFAQEVRDDVIYLKISDGQSLQMPSYVGRTRQEVEADSAYSHLNVKWVSAGPSEDHRANEVLTQSVAAGQEVAYGSEVTLTYSEGPKDKGVLPDFVDVYGNGDIDAYTIKEHIEQYLSKNGFKNYTVLVGDYGGSKNTVAYQNVKGSVFLSTEVIVHIQK